jgi:hypothetical protein
MHGDGDGYDGEVRDMSRPRRKRVKRQLEGGRVWVVLTAEPRRGPQTITRRQRQQKRHADADAENR